MQLHQRRKVNCWVFRKWSASIILKILHFQWHYLNFNDNIVFDNLLKSLIVWTETYKRTHEFSHNFSFSLNFVHFYMRLKSFFHDKQAKKNIKFSILTCNLNFWFHCNFIWRNLFTLIKRNSSFFWRLNYNWRNEIFYLNFTITIFSLHGFNLHFY